MTFSYIVHEQDCLCTYMYIVLVAVVTLDGGYISEPDFNRTICIFAESRYHSLTSS